MEVLYCFVQNPYSTSQPLMFSVTVSKQYRKSGNLTSTYANAMRCEAYNYALSRWVWDILSWEKLVNLVYTFGKVTLFSI